MTGTKYGARALWVTTHKLKVIHMKHFGDIPHDGTIIPACSGFIYHRMFFENCDAGPIHTDNTEIIAWAIEDGDIYPVVPDGIIREFTSDKLKACVISPSGRTCVPQVGDYDSFANWERDALEAFRRALDLDCDNGAAKANWQTLVAREDGSD